MSEVDLRSLSQIATCFITSNSKIALPKTLHDALNNIFTKGKGDQVKFRKKVIKNVTKPGNKVLSYCVYKENRNAIYNALCLYAIIGTSETKKLFQHYYATKSFTSKRDFTNLYKLRTTQYLEFACFGITYENINNIELSLLEDSFDLFTDKLPSPFSVREGVHSDLSPMLDIYGVGIPWDQYMVTYNKAENYFQIKEYGKAKKLLEQLDQQSSIQLPIIKSLLRRISLEITEANEAWEYFQKILN